MNIKTHEEKIYKKSRKFLIPNIVGIILNIIIIGALLIKIDRNIALIVGFILTVLVAIANNNFRKNNLMQSKKIFITLVVTFLIACFACYLWFNNEGKEGKKNMSHTRGLTPTLKNDSVIKNIHVVNKDSMGEKNNVKEKKKTIKGKK